MYHALFKDGEIIPKGEKYYRPEYARTLQLIADGGADAFYAGEIAEALVNVVQERGGLMTLDDLKSKCVFVDADHRLQSHMGGTDQCRVQRTYAVHSACTRFRSDMA